MKGISLPSRALALVAAPLLIVALAGLREWRRGGAEARGPDLSDWDVPRLLEHLRARGMTFRPVSASAKGGATHNVFLTTTDKDWLELTSPPKVVERIDSWQGTLYCERIDHPGSRDVQLALWGDCCLVAGPFLFFGDRAMLAQVRDALGQPA
jgi:hypothetical protein